MGLFKFTELELDNVQKPFSQAYCSHPAISKLAEERGIKFIPFDSKREFKNIQLLYPAWTARELAINTKVKSAMSKLWIYEKYADNFVTCLHNGEICFAVGFAPVENRSVLELSFVSGKPLKHIWSHKFAEVFSLYLSYLMKAFPKHSFIASCDADVPVYSNFVKHFNFIFWEEFLAYGRKYLLHVFCPF